MGRKAVLLIESRIDQPHHAPFAVLQADHFARTHQTLVHVRPLPQTRFDRGHRMIWQSLHAEPPITREIFSRHVAVEKDDAIGLSCLFHSQRPLDCFSNTWFSPRRHEGKRARSIAPTKSISFAPLRFWRQFSDSESSSVNDLNGLNGWNDWNELSPLFPSPRSRRDRLIVNHIHPH